MTRVAKNRVFALLNGIRIGWRIARGPMLFIFVPPSGFFLTVGFIYINKIYKILRQSQSYFLNSPCCHNFSPGGPSPKRYRPLGRIMRKPYADGVYDSAAGLRRAHSNRSRARNHFACAFHPTNIFPHLLNITLTN